MASALWTMPRSATRARARFSPMDRTAVWSRSTKTALAAPRERASMPPAPEPANRSRTTAPGKIGSKIAKRVCLTRSPIGRVPSPGATSRVPRALPAMTRPASLIVGARRAVRIGGGIWGSSVTSRLGEDLACADPGQPAGTKFGPKDLMPREQRAVLVEELLGDGSGQDGPLAIALVVQ